MFDFRHPNNQQVLLNTDGSAADVVHGGAPPGRSRPETNRRMQARSRDSKAVIGEPEEKP